MAGQWRNQADLKFLGEDDDEMLREDQYSQIISNKEQLKLQQKKREQQLKQREGFNGQFVPYSQVIPNSYNIQPRMVSYNPYSEKFSGGNNIDNITLEDLFGDLISEIELMAFITFLVIIITSIIIAVAAYSRIDFGSIKS